MIKTIVAVLFALVVILCVSSAPVAAQTGPSCTGWFFCSQYSLWDATCIPAIPPETITCYPNGPWSLMCVVLSDQCFPAAAPAETTPGKCPNCQGQAGSPISLLSGNTFIEENDIRIPGLSSGLTLLRTWNSAWPSTQSAYQIGLFGPNWRSNFEERVFVGGDHFLKYARGDGSFWSFGYNSGVHKVAAPANVTAMLVQGSAYWTLTFQNGEQRLFDNTTGKLLSIIDRNGNTTQLSYDSLGRLTTVTDPASRHLYFWYGDGSSYLVTSVTSDVGLSVSYSYDSQGRLSQVTEPDQSTLSFQYNSQSLISAVVDSHGKLLESHTYDSSGRGLTSSRANGVDAVTISYGNP